MFPASPPQAVRRKPKFGAARPAMSVSGSRPSAPQAVGRIDEPALALDRLGTAESGMGVEDRQQESSPMPAVALAAPIRSASSAMLA